MSRRLLVWIRHAAASPDPEVPARDWPLAPAAAEAMARLAPVLAGLAPPLSVVSSDERKAVETAGLITAALDLGPAEICAGLREVERSWTGRDYRAVAREYLRSGSVAGWEPHGSVRERLGAALAEHWRPEGTTVAVGHGLAISLWAAAALPAVDAAGFWDRLEFPDAWRFTGADGAFERLAP